MWYKHRTAHQTLRVTGAMEGGVTDHVWSVEEIVRRLRPKGAVTIMSIVKRCEWILIGVIIGALAASSIDAVKAQGSADAARLKVSALVLIGQFGVGAFVKDTKSTGCWLASANGIAVAPLEACQQ